MCVGTILYYFTIYYSKLDITHFSKPRLCRSERLKVDTRDRFSVFNVYIDNNILYNLDAIAILIKISSAYRHGGA